MKSKFISQSEEIESSFNRKDIQQTTSETLLSLVSLQNRIYDYEISHCKLEGQSLYYPEIKKNSLIYKSLVFSHINDVKDIEIQDGKSCRQSEMKNRANPLKRIVSKKKRRFESQYFDLDLAYITRRVIAMGFPSTGCETLYRNSLKDLKGFFHHYHPEGVKIYNLCIEKDRIYDRSLFASEGDEHPKLALGLLATERTFPCSLFPFKDHNPPPIKLILEFCIDLCIYLTKNPKGAAAVHCKAGKGRTGLMIICYLIFSELCEDASQAINHYAKMRTYNNKGVTIPSQIRYICYFEMFLNLNFTKPYVRMIPKMIKTQFQNSLHSKNMIKNFLNDPSYFYSPNYFKLVDLTIGPFREKVNLGVSLYNNELKMIKFKYDKEIIVKYCNFREEYYFRLTFISMPEFNCDIRINVNGMYQFYFWVNLWYSTLEMIGQIIQKNGLFSSQTVHVSKAVTVTKGLSNVLNKGDKKKTGIQGTQLACAQVDDPTQEEDKDASRILQLMTYLDSLNSNSDLLPLISATDKVLAEKKLGCLNRKKLSVLLCTMELDKFKRAKEVSDYFRVTLRYSIE